MAIGSETATLQPTGFPACAFRDPIGAQPPADLVTPQKGAERATCFRGTVDLREGDGGMERSV